MNKNKIATIVAVALLSHGIFAQEQTVQKQNQTSKSETSVEQEYLSDIDGVVVLSLAQSDEYDNKQLAMQMLESAVEEGNTSEDVMKALNQLAGEGINTQSRTNGRLMNNFPDIRRRACLAAAVNSLGEIGINNGDEVVDAISFANRRNEILNPTSSLAFEVIDAYEKLADVTENKKIIIDSLARIAADYHYVTPVRNKALNLLKKMKDTGSQNKSASEAK